MLGYRSKGYFGTGYSYIDITRSNKTTKKKLLFRSIWKTATTKMCGRTIGTYQIFGKKRGFDLICSSQILVWGVKPTFCFYCIMRSFQLIKVLVFPEETVLVFLEETLLGLHGAHHPKRPRPTWVPFALIILRLMKNPCRASLHGYQSPISYPCQTHVL